MVHSSKRRSVNCHLMLPISLQKWVAVMNRHDLQSLALVNRVFFDAADLWIWRDVALRAMANCPFTPMQRRLNALLGRSDQGKMLRNLQLLFDANLPEIGRASCRERV